MLVNLFYTFKSSHNCQCCCWICFFLVSLFLSLQRNLFFLQLVYFLISLQAVENCVQLLKNLFEIVIYLLMSEKPQFVYWFVFHAFRQLTQSYYFQLYDSIFLCWLVTIALRICTYITFVVDSFSLFRLIVLYT